MNEAFFDKHPKSTEVICKWFGERFIQSLENQQIDEQFKEFVRGVGIDRDKVIKMVNANPRSLFDFFDENEIYITSGKNLTDEGVYHCCTIGDESDVMWFKMRKEAEKDAIMRAFSILEEKL